MSLDPNVRAAVDAYLASTVGLIDGLYLYGSVALGDFHPPHSDIDFVAIVDRPLDKAALDSVHRSLPGPVFDGIYLTTAQLAAGPVDLAPTHFARERRLHEPGRFEQNPVTWHSLAGNGIRCGGPELGDLEIWRDPAELARWTRGNVEEYWRDLLKRGGAYDLEPFPGGMMWVVLGVPRLHYTLATRAITSKSGAGEYALTVFDEEWHDLIRACLAQRRGGEAPSPSLWPHALDFLAMSIDETLRL